MWVLCASLAQSDNDTVLLFKPADNVLPSPMGDLSSSISQVMIKVFRGVVNSLITLNAKYKTAKISSRGETGFSRKYTHSRCFTQPNCQSPHIDSSLCIMTCHAGLDSSMHSCTCQNNPVRMALAVISFFFHLSTYHSYYNVLHILPLV